MRLKTIHSKSIPSHISNKRHSSNSTAKCGDALLTKLKSRYADPVGTKPSANVLEDIIVEENKQLAVIAPEAVRVRVIYPAKEERTECPDPYIKLRDKAFRRMGTYLNRENIEYESKAYLKHEYRPELEEDLRHSIDIEIGELGSASGQGPTREAAEVIAYTLMTSLAEAYVQNRNKLAALGAVAGDNPSIEILSDDFAHGLLEFD